MTFRTILVPLDGSQFGEHALPHAIGLARRTGGRIVLAHVHTPPVVFGSADIHLPMTPDDDGEIERVSRAYLDDAAGRVRAATGGDVSTAFRTGHVADALCELTETEAADLVVMTTHGRGPLSRLWLGSVATELVHRCPTPLLLTRPAEAPPDLAADVAPRRILIPLDGSPFAEGVIPLAVALGTASEAAYRLLRVVPPILTSGRIEARGPLVPPRTVADELRVEAASYLVGMRMKVPALKSADTRVVVEWPPAGIILADAEAHGVDLIAMTTRGRGGLARLFLGSVADKVVRGATVPVLLRRPDTAE